MSAASARSALIVVFKVRLERNALQPRIAPPRQPVLERADRLAAIGAIRGVIAVMQDDDVAAANALKARDQVPFAARRPVAAHQAPHDDAFQTAPLDRGVELRSAEPPRRTGQRR